MKNEISVAEWIERHNHEKVQPYTKRILKAIKRGDVIISTPPRVPSVAELIYLGSEETK